VLRPAGEHEHKKPVLTPYSHTLRRVAFPALLDRIPLKACERRVTSYSRWVAPGTVAHAGARFQVWRHSLRESIGESFKANSERCKVPA
jgi:hypothetical protein